MGLAKYGVTALMKNSGEPVNDTGQVDYCRISYRDAVIIKDRLEKEADRVVGPDRLYRWVVVDLESGREVFVEKIVAPPKNKVGVSDETFAYLTKRSR